MKSPYREAIRQVSGLDPRLVEAIVLQESAGRADAFRYEPAYYNRYIAPVPKWDPWEPRRVASSYGLMQVMYPTALQVGYEGAPEGLFDIPINIQVGSWVLADLLEWAKGDLPKAIAAYNGGRGNWMGPKAQRYAQEVLMRIERG